MHRKYNEKRGVKQSFFAKAGVKNQDFVKFDPIRLTRVLFFANVKCVNFGAARLAKAPAGADEAVCSFLVYWTYYGK